MSISSIQLEMMSVQSSNWGYLIISWEKILEYSVDSKAHFHM